MGCVGFHDFKLWFFHPPFQEKKIVHVDAYKKSQYNRKASIFFTFFEEIYFCFGHIIWMLKLHCKVKFPHSYSLQAVMIDSKYFQFPLCTPGGVESPFFSFLLHLHDYARWSSVWNYEWLNCSSRLKKNNNKYNPQAHAEVCSTNSFMLLA